MRDDLGQTGFTVFPVKTQKLTAKPQQWLVTTWREITSWLYLRRAIFNFTVFKHWNFSFSISALVEQIWMTFYRKAMLNQEDRISRSDTAGQRVWEREKMSQSQAIFPCVCFTCRSKGHASWLWLVVFDTNFFFMAEKPFTHDVNLHRCKFSQFALAFRSIR